MSYLMNNEQKLTEIVFANRNKNYGAYVIRSTYGETVLKALLMTTGLVTAAFVTGYFLSTPADPSKSETIPIQDSIYSIPVNLAEEKPAEESLPKKPAAAAAQNNQAELINPLVSDSVETESSTDSLSTRNELSADDAGEEGLAQDPGSGDGGAEGASASATVSVIRSVIHVQKLPEFEGGLNALYRFVAANIRYTDEALEAGQGGKIYVQFVVDEEGKISSITLMNKLGYGLDEEALRVVGIIPKFKTPAMVDGKPVKMYYQLPINFKIR